MSELAWDDATYPLDERGFLADSGCWNPDFVDAMAREMGCPHGLTLPQWRVVISVRRHYVRHWDIPRIHVTCHECGLTLTKLRALFPDGYQRGVCRLAGIPYSVIDACHYALTYETRPKTDTTQPTSDPELPH